MSELEPLLVSVREARRLLGGVSNNKFWKLVAAGEFELVGNERKRFVTLVSLRSYVDHLPRRQATPEAAD